MVSDIRPTVMHAVSRMNLRSTDGLNTNVCPRVHCTGYRPTYKSELGLSFGDYVESYDPKANERSNDVLKARTKPCIALYPTANRNGSWVLYNLTTKSCVRRS
jgi:hypothetical protein